MTVFYDPCNDIAFKKVFNEHKDLTISFLNAVLRLTGDRSIVDVDFLPQECLPLIEESKKSILDVRCTDQRNFQYIVEVQNSYNLPYLSRVQYYASHVYTGQMKRAEDYGSLKPVTMLSIMRKTVFDFPGYLSFHSNVEAETGKSYLNDMSYVFIELPKFTLTESELKTPENHWIYMLKEAKRTETVPAQAPKEVKDAFSLLAENAWSSPEQEAYFRANLYLLDEKAKEKSRK